MRPAFRIVTASLAALLLTLAVVSASVAHRPPPHPAKRTHTVSANVPYVAPWQAGFEKFATQIYAPSTLSSGIIGMVIPPGQWWRIIYLTTHYSASAVANARVVIAEIVDSTNAIVLKVATPVTLAATDVADFLYGPGLTSFGNTTSKAQQFGTATMPDVLWPGGSTVQITCPTFSAGDTFTLSTFAIEIYTEGPRGNLVPQKLTPTPLIS